MLGGQHLICTSSGRIDRGFASAGKGVSIRACGSSNWFAAWMAVIHLLDALTAEQVMALPTARLVQACCGSHVLTMAASLELFGLLALGGAIVSTRAILSSRSRVLLPGLPQLRRSFSAVFSIIFETVESRRFVSALVQRRFDGSTARSWLPTSTGALASSRFRR